MFKQFRKTKKKKIIYEKSIFFLNILFCFSNREGNEESSGVKATMTSGVGNSPDVVAMEPRNGGGSVSVGIADGGGGIVNPAFQPPSLLSQQSTVWTRRQQAVCVRHAFKHYGSASKPNHVLSNLNMTVAKGTMLVQTISYS